MTELRTRREPPAFRRLSVREAESVSRRMTRVILGGSELEGFSIDLPAASVRLLLPTDGELEIPVWAGNEFLLNDGTRPIIRTFTPRRFDAGALELCLDVVLHGAGVASTWAETTEPGDEVAVSGPGRGYDIDPDATGFLLAGDETAIPAICQLLECLPEVPIVAHLLVSDESARVDLHRAVDITWHMMSNGSDRHDLLHNAIRTPDLSPDLQIWAAGEAAAMQRIRNYLFREIDFPRSQATVRGYWKSPPQGFPGLPADIA
jgi:NADPH-dependent ferric siderophore reductase